MKTEIKHVLIAFTAVIALVVGFVRLDVEVPLLGHLGSALVAVTLLFTPAVVAWRRGEDLVTYGFTSEPLGRGLLLGLGVPAVVLPLFALAYLGFYHVVCGSDSLAILAPPGLCSRFAGAGGLTAPHLDLAFAEFVLIQIVVVALPEELLFRGCFLHLLERALPPRRRVLGGGIGWALVISALLFAVLHIPRDGDPRNLATFFPALLFGWLRSATGSILAPTLAHASSNVFIRILERAVMG